MLNKDKNKKIKETTTSEINHSQDSSVSQDNQKNQSLSNFLNNIPQEQDLSLISIKNLVEVLDLPDKINLQDADKK